MSSVRGVSLVLAMVLVWAVSSFYTAESSRSVAPERESFRWGLDVQSSDGPSLAARYHLRNRTKRFFERSAGQPQGHRRAVGRRHVSTAAEAPQLAARYYLRGRTARFFRRATG